MPGYRAFIDSDMDNLMYLVPYYPHPKRWEENFIPIDDPIRDSRLWSPEFKYLNSTNDGLSDEIKNISKDHGGIYVFSLKGISIPFMENYILYIGRCKFTVNQNLKKRAKEYIKDDRIFIRNMFERWKQHLYYRYYPETNNDRIVKIEELLIRAIVPPLNEAIPNKTEIQPTVPAFN